MSNVTPHHAPLTPAQQLLVANHLRLAAALAGRRLKSRVRTADWQDAYQEMVLALMEAASRWVDGRGKTFTSYAYGLMLWRGGRMSAHHMRDASLVVLSTGEATERSVEARMADPAPSAEAQLVQAAALAEARAQHFGKLSPADRLTVERVMAGASIAAPAAARLIGLVQGVTGTNVERHAARLAHANRERTRAWYVALSPRRRQARLARVAAASRVRRALNAGMAVAA